MPCPAVGSTVQGQSTPSHAAQRQPAWRAMAKWKVNDTQPPLHYEITVQGVLGPRWSAWFEGLQLTSDAGQTTIAGPVADQAALHGLLAKIRDLGLPLLAVRRTDHQDR